MQKDIGHHPRRSGGVFPLLMVLQLVMVKSLAAQPPGPPEPVDSKTNLRLTGVIINNDSRSALIKIGNAREKEFVQGQQIRINRVRINRVREQLFLI